MLKKSSAKKQNLRARAREEKKKRNSRLKIETMCEETPIHLCSRLTDLQRGRETGVRRVRKGGVMSRWVKIT